jgi:predicted ArsR family transcriptional regulator
MESYMTILQKVKNVLVNERREATAKQMAAWFNTTPKSISARVSELRTENGFAIYANQKTDSKGRTATFYRLGNPSRKVVAAGYRALGAQNAV